MDFFYDKFIEKAEILHYYLYNKPLDMSLITLTPQSLQQTKPLSTQEQLFVGLLNTISAFNSERAKQVISLLPKLSNDSEYFYKAVNSLNNASFALLDPVYINSNLYPNSNLSDFVINLETKKLFSIPRATKIPLETIRQAAVILNSEKYFCAYSHSTYHTPILNASAKLLFKKMAAKSTKVIYEEDIKELLSIDPTHKYSIARTLLKYIQTYKSEIANNWNKLRESKETLFSNVKQKTDALKEYESGINDCSHQMYAEAIQKVKRSIVMFKLAGNSEYHIARAHLALCLMHERRNSENDRALSKVHLDKAFEGYSDKNNNSDEKIQPAPK